MVWNYGDSERLERTRRRKLRQKRIALAFLVVCTGLFVGGGWWIAIRSVPLPPCVTVTWPSPIKYGTRTFVPVAQADRGAGYAVADLLIRKGQPFTISVNDAEKWTVHGISEEADERAATMHWAPVDGKGASLKIFCRPIASGWHSLVGWMWPTYTLHLRGVMPQPLPDGRFSLPSNSSAPGSDIFLSANTLGSGGSTTWDDRIVPLLEAAAQTLSPVKGAAESVVPDDASLVKSSAPARWRILEGYQGKRIANDYATYGTLTAVEKTTDATLQNATRLARLFASKEPQASVKFVVVEKKERVSSVFRLAFDGKAARDGWVKRVNERQATPLQWWSATLGDNDQGEPVSPAPPQ